LSLTNVPQAGVGEAKIKIEAWLRDYPARPKSSIEVQASVTSGCLVNNLKPTSFFTGLPIQEIKSNGDIVYKINPVI
jgi:hypothetical protein